MRWVLHDWSDEESVALLKNVRKIATANARLMVVESVIPETSDFDMGKWMDLNMMMMATGRERTAAEFGDLPRSGRLCARADCSDAFPAEHRRGKTKRVMARRPPFPGVSAGRRIGAAVGTV